MTAEVVTPVSGPGKVLIGRRTAKEFTTLLHRGERLCIGKATLSERA